MNLNQSQTSEAHDHTSRKHTISTSSSSDITVPDGIIIDSIFSNDEEMFLRQKGYEKVRKICDTLQGDLFEGRFVHSAKKKVAIKRIFKSLHQQGIAKMDEEGMRICVEENIVTESLILRHLSVDNRSTADYIVRYMDHFESDQYFYLIMEYIDSDMNLKQFIKRAHKYIRCGKLKKKEFYKTVKYIFWQLFAVINWMHNDMSCCHLDLVLENIMLENATFKTQKDGSICINPRINPKMCDFGRSELFQINKANPNASFLCEKHSLLDTIQYASPQLYQEQIFDARKQDIFSLGMMLYHCVVTTDWDNERYNGYLGIQNGELIKYLSENKLDTNMSDKLVDLLDNVLNIYESERYLIMDILKHAYFKEYYKKYRKRIAEKSKIQKQKLSLQKDKLAHFPYYTKINAFNYAVV